jgi:acyl phosphate:glycerol-3-phosphate acyltransferase
MIEGLTPLAIAAALIGGYLLGSIPFGVIVTRLGGAGDVRKIGSGNIGATNVLRTGRKDLAALTLLGDAGKGVLAVLLARAIWGEAAGALAGGAAFAGHLFPVWLRFKGGKGVATALGVMLAASWPVGVLALLTWIVVLAIFRISSLSALTAAVLSPLYAALVHAPEPVRWLILFAAVMVVLRHRPNINRLLKGQEPRVGRGRAAVAPQGPTA